MEALPFTNEIFCQVTDLHYLKSLPLIENEQSFSVHLLVSKDEACNISLGCSGSLIIHAEISYSVPSQFCSPVQPGQWWLPA
jgi:hypothetical protein